MTTEYHEDGASLAQAAAGFLADGLRQGEAALVLSVPEHAEAIAAALGRHERIRFADAREIFGGGGAPDPEAFAQVLGEASRVLWTSRDVEATLGLEDVWPVLQGRRPFRRLSACDLSGSGSPRLQAAVDGAFDDLLGPLRSAALRPLVAASLRGGGESHPAAKALFWGLTHLRGKRDALLAALRRRLGGMDIASTDASAVDRIRILYAEDDENDVFFLRHAATKAAPEVDLAVVSDGDAARETLSAAGPRPDLVLLDLKLPKRNGLEVLQWMRAEPALADTPTVVLTSSTEKGDIEKAQRGGADLYLAKQTDLARLAVIVRGLAAYAAVSRTAT